MFSAFHLSFPEFQSKNAPLLLSHELPLVLDDRQNEACCLPSCALVKAVSLQEFTVGRTMASDPQICVSATKEAEWPFARLCGYQDKYTTEG